MSVQDRRIRLLPKTLAEMIAAGEVIERPASIVKELVENSIDAGAREIQITITQGGKTLIEVSDDGHGIYPDDLVTALERHATSKIYEEADLLHIASLGFRGEALASIAAVADITIESRHAQATQAACLVKAATQQQPTITPTARNVGTTVRVEHLFAAIPARKKFLRSDRSETQAIRDLVTVFFLAQPEIGFRYVQDQRVVVNAPAASLDQRLKKLFPTAQFRNIDFHNQQMRLSGLLSSPQEHRANGQDFYLFVNRRYVRDPLLRKSLQRAYDGLIPPGRYPFGVLFIDLPASDVDVNVHPTKTEVRFLHPGDMFSMLHDVVKQTLTSQRTPPGRPVASAEPTATSTQAPRRWEDLPAVSAALQTSTTAYKPFSTLATRTSQTTKNPVQQIFNVAENDQPWGSKQLQPLGQLGRRYLLYQEDHALIIVDQHAAHERIRYDKIMKALQTGQGVAQQELLTPEIIQVEPAQWEGFQHGDAILQKIGFVLEPFGKDCLRIRTVPAWFAGNLTETIHETLNTLSRYPDATTLDKHMHDLAAMLACKGAILSGREVALPEQNQLLEQLRATPSGETCPHGRPTYRRMTQQELDRWFGR